MERSNPDGAVIRAALHEGWAEELVCSSSYGAELQRWILERLRLIPADAAVAGGFGHALIELLESSQVQLDVFLERLRYVEQPNRFRAMPLNHYLLSLVHAAQALGGTGALDNDLGLLREAVRRPLGAVLLHRTMAGYQGRAKVSYALKQISKAMGGVLFSDLRVTILRRFDGYRVQHRQDYNFLGQVFYPPVYFDLLAGEEALVESVTVSEVGVAAWDIRIYLPARYHDMPSLG